MHRDPSQGTTVHVFLRRVLAGGKNRVRWRTADPIRIKQEKNATPPFVVGHDDRSSCGRRRRGACLQLRCAFGGGGREECLGKDTYDTTSSTSTHLLSSPRPYSTLDTYHSRIIHQQPPPLPPSASLHLPSSLPSQRISLTSRNTTLWQRPYSFALAFASLTYIRAHTHAHVHAHIIHPPSLSPSSCPPSLIAAFPIPFPLYTYTSYSQHAFARTNLPRPVHPCLCHTQPGPRSHRRSKEDLSVCLSPRTLHVWDDRC